MNRSGVCIKNQDQLLLLLFRLECSDMGIGISDRMHFFLGFRSGGDPEGGMCFPELDQSFVVCHILLVEFVVQSIPF